MRKTFTQKQIIDWLVDELQELEFTHVDNARGLFADLASNYGCKVRDTHGQPFNGSTYEIYREVTIDDRKLIEVIGHFRNIREIYGKEHILLLYNNNIEGGKNLNGNNNYLIRVVTYKN